MHRYIEIGNLNHFGDRLRFQCEGAEKGTQDETHIILGTVCNIDDDTRKFWMVSSQNREDSVGTKNPIKFK